MLIVIKTEKSHIYKETIAEIFKHLDGVVDINSLDVYDEDKVCISNKIPVFPMESLRKTEDR